MREERVMKYGTLQGVLAQPLEMVFETAARLGFAGVELDWNALDEARGEAVLFSEALESVLALVSEDAAALVEVE